MTKVICGPASVLPTVIPAGTYAFEMYSNSGLPNVGTIAPGWVKELKKKGLAPTEVAWDFVTIALAVGSADLICQRTGSADGWTRQIELDVAIVNPVPWCSLAHQLEDTLRFLTGDIWKIVFREGGPSAPRPSKAAITDRDCVALLSGGLDSLVGGIDLIQDGRRPIFVSQGSRGDAEAQILFANTLSAGAFHLQWNHRIRHTNKLERSTRGRSIVFLGFAVLASCLLPEPQSGRKQIVISENGYISLNVALNPGRLGSFSTRTTHPVFLAKVQSIIHSAGIKLEWLFPYRLKTKGEMLVECRNRTLLGSLASQSISCGRYLKYGYKHCGRCVPCLVRRAAFKHAGMIDTTHYHFAALNIAGADTGANDIGAIAQAILRLEQEGVKSVLGSALSFFAGTERAQLEDLVKRGLQELASLLRGAGVI